MFFTSFLFLSDYTLAHARSFVNTFFKKCLFVFVHCIISKPHYKESKNNTNNHDHIIHFFYFLSFSFWLYISTGPQECQAFFKKKIKKRSSWPIRFLLTSAVRWSHWPIQHWLLPTVSVVAIFFCFLSEGVCSPFWFFPRGLKPRRLPPWLVIRVAVVVSRLFVFWGSLLSPFGLFSRNLKPRRLASWLVICVAVIVSQFFVLQGVCSPSLCLYISTSCFVCQAFFYFFLEVFGGACSGLLAALLRVIFQLSQPLGLY